jgi:hypothetical protein
MRQTAIESLHDSQWVRSSSSARCSVPDSGSWREAHLGEADVQRGELLVATIGLGTAGGGLLGALFGNAVPRWKRSYP